MKQLMCSLFPFFFYQIIIYKIYFFIMSKKICNWTLVISELQIYKVEQGMYAIKANSRAHLVIH